MKLISDLTQKGNVLFQQFIKQPKSNSSGNTSPKVQSSADTAGLVFIKNIRYWSSDSYTRIVIDLNKKANYKKQWLKEDKKHNKPPRLFIDIKQSKVNERCLKRNPYKGRSCICY